MHVFDPQAAAGLRGLHGIVHTRPFGTIADAPGSQSSVHTFVPGVAHAAPFVLQNGRHAPYAHVNPFAH
jgi:hypothetical protein